MFKKEAINERKEFNKELYAKIFSITKKPKSILDLGCGLNPVYFPYKDIYYIASDIDKKSLKKVKKHFKKTKINGDLFHLDLNHSNKLKTLKKVDLTLIFKVLDNFNKSTIKEIIKNTKTNYFIISFPTKTISGKRMNQPKRKWFESLFKTHKKLRFHNEVFYIIKKAL